MEPEELVEEEVDEVAGMPADDMTADADEADEADDMDADDETDEDEEEVDESDDEAAE